MNPILISGWLLVSVVAASPLIDFHIDDNAKHAYHCESVDGKAVAYDRTCSEMPNAVGCNAGRQGLNCRFCGFSVYPACPGESVDPDQPKMLKVVKVTQIEGDIGLIDQTPDEFYAMIESQNLRFAPLLKRLNSAQNDPSDELVNMVNNAILNRRRLWPNGVVPYLITKSFSEKERNVLLKAISTLEEYTCIKFVQRTDEKNYVHIFRGSGCYALIGRYGGGQPLSIGYGCLYTGTVMHELMHTLGFFHEQSRADRDDYINIHMNNVLSGTEPNFKKYTLEKIDHLGEPYDLGSLLHYNNYAFSKNGQKTIVAKNGFELKHSGFKDVPTKIDAAKINKLYGCDPNYKLNVTKSPTTPQPTTPVPTTTADPTPNCRDINPSCEGWARHGQCGTNKKYMNLACERSCKACIPGRKHICEDHEDACPTWATKGECKMTPEYMRVVCPLSCGHCVKSCDPDSTDGYVPKTKHEPLLLRSKRETKFMSPQSPMLPIVSPGPQ